MTKRAKTATRRTLIERRVSAKRLIPRIEALERGVDILKRRIAIPRQGCVRDRATVSHREPGCRWPSRAGSAQGGKLIGYIKGVHVTVDRAERGSEPRRRSPNPEVML
jgi:hypothetical protein